MKLATVAVCNLCQWSLDFDGNLNRIIESIRKAKELNAKYRLGPELEITGYSCEDHFLEEDTYLHSWQSIAQLLKTDATDDILCDIGMPINHKNVRYNCRIFILNRKIVFIRPKIYLADDGNYREPRWFTTWKHIRKVEDYYLPNMIREITGQTKVPFGDAAIATLDTCLAPESCEELFTPNSPHIYLGLNGVEFFSNGSGSHHQLRKLHTRVDLMKSATAKAGGIYMYSNQLGCDGNRLYFDGCAMIVVNGQVVAQGSQFALRDVEVIAATVDIEEVRSYRGSIASRSVQASESEKVERIDISFKLTSDSLTLSPTNPINVNYFKVEEEIAYGPASWLWDYLRRSGMRGYFLPLSGGADSSAVAAIVGVMTQMIVSEVEKNNQSVIDDIKRILDGPDINQEKLKEIMKDPKKICNRLFFTCYMGTVNSSAETRDRAAQLAKEIGSFHLSLTIDEIIKSFGVVFKQVSEKVPKFKTNGGSITENLALQNIQARSRMVLAYFLSGLLLWTQNRPGGLLNLGSANVDEALRGYYTKYDCSSADINPIGGISKTDLKKFLIWASKEKSFPILFDVVNAQPTAELEPMTKDYVQLDEVDMGMTYEELSVFGRLRKIHRCGPYSMFQKLVHEWPKLTAEQVAEKVKRFFFFYSINRHKMTTLTPSYHAENYGPDDNRFDLRQFLYNSKWTRQFKCIDEMAKKIDEARKQSNNMIVQNQEKK